MISAFALLVGVSEVFVERLRPGLVLADRYRLIGHVASGGMGQVWDGFDDVLERRVALKVMHPHTQDEFAMVERFRAEAKFAAQVVHPHIVTVHDYVEDDGLACLVMELVDGPALAKLLARGPLSADQAEEVLVQLASALAVAHASSIIHRDIKPANVLISEAGGAQLTDFGIARSIGTFSHTLTGQVLGTAHYLSPEQALGQSLEAPTDIYGLGVLAHEMLTGEKPFHKPTPIATALAHVQDPPPPLPDEVPKVLADLIARCMAKAPDDRPSAQEIVDLLRPTPRALTDPGALAAAGDTARGPQRAMTDPALDPDATVLMKPPPAHG